MKLLRHEWDLSLAPFRASVSQMRLRACIGHVKDRPLMPAFANNIRANDGSKLPSVQVLQGTLDCPPKSAICFRFLPRVPEQGLKRSIVGVAETIPPDGNGQLRQDHNQHLV